MTLWQIAFRSIRQRGVASLLTIASMALGVMLVVSVLSIHGVVSQSFQGNSTLGYNMIVGPKGGKLQLTLNTVYHLSEPIENVPYDYYLEFLPAQQRSEELKNSYKYHSHQPQWQTAELQAAAMLGTQSLPGLLALDALEAEEDESLSRGGRYGNYTELAIPLCLGDFYGRFRVVGTSPALFDDLVYDLDQGKKFEFADGRNFKRYSEENRYNEAVIGATVAREMGIGVGHKFNPSHGVQDGEVHEENQFTVVGVLAPSNTPNDRGVFINMEGFYLIPDHFKSIPGAADTDLSEPLPVELREVTSILVKSTKPIYAPSISNGINEGRLEDSVKWSSFRPEQIQTSAQTVSPVAEIYNLFEIIVRPVQSLLLVMTGMICVVSGVSILVSMYNSMNERKHEIAVMRALGAARGTIVTVIMLESVMLALIGGAIGWTAAHTLNMVASPYIETRTGVSIGFFDLAPAIDLKGLLKSKGYKYLQIAVTVFGGLLILAAFGLFVQRRTWNLLSSQSVLVLLGAVCISAIWLFEQISIEVMVIPALVLLAVVVGVIPAVSAYRTDVAQSLGA